MHLVVRADHPLARRREVALRKIAGVPLAMPVAPNSLGSLLVGLAAARHFALDVRFESGSSPLTRDAILASGLATVSPIEAFRREIEAGEMRAIRIVRPSIRQTRLISLGSARPPSAAARVVARLIRELARRAS
jgi:LysR family transcriptional regulator, nitrogen assimilation regulatory protein